MHIAYYEENDYHTEIFCFILDYCLYHGYTCDYYNNKDQSYFLEHYENVFKLHTKIKRYNNSSLRENIDKYNYIIVGTMGCTLLIDDLIKDNGQKFIQIYHNRDDLIKESNDSYIPNISNTSDLLSKVIVLTPLNSHVGPYLLPIFEPFLRGKMLNFNSCSELDASLLAKRQKQKIITIVGRFTKHRTCEAILPLLESDYTIWIITRKAKFVPPQL